MNDAIYNSITSDPRSKKTVDEIVGCLTENEPLTRHQIAMITNLGIDAVDKNVTKLLKMGWLKLERHYNFVYSPTDKLLEVLDG